MAPSPSFGLRPAAASASPYRAKVFGKNARTAWPKMIGSETFIIVALRCTENSTPSALARAIWAVEELAQRRHPHDRGVHDLAGEHRHRLRGARSSMPSSADQLDAQRRRPRP